MRPNVPLLLLLVLAAACAGQDRADPDPGSWLRHLAAGQTHLGEGRAREAVAELELAVEFSRPDAASGRDRLHRALEALVAATVASGDLEAAERWEAERRGMAWDRAYQQDIPGGSFCNWFRDTTLGDGPFPAPGRRVRFRIESVPPRPGVGEEIEVVFGAPGIDPGLAVAIRSMRQGGAREVKIRREVAPLLDELRPAGQPQIEVRLVLLEVRD